MGVVIVFLVLALAAAGALLAVVARPHMRGRRDRAEATRHTSRTTRASS